MERQRFWAIGAAVVGALVGANWSTTIFACGEPTPAGYEAPLADRSQQQHPRQPPSGGDRQQTTAPAASREAAAVADRGGD